MNFNNDYDSFEFSFPNLSFEEKEFNELLGIESLPKSEIKFDNFPESDSTLLPDSPITSL